jgi:large subunit ribosomal protein L10
MTRAEKTTAIAELKEKFSNNSFFYLTDSSTLTVEQVNKLRGLCFEKGVEMKVVKNTLAIKALEDAPEEKGYSELFQSLKGPTAIMFTETANVPAKIIEEFRKDHERPILKAAYIDTSVYVGDDQVKALAALKSKEELIGEIIGLLQSPAKTVISSLKSGGATIMGLLKALEERAEE